jgi:hypothetical protein
VSPEFKRYLAGVAIGLVALIGLGVIVAAFGVALVAG